MYRIYKGFKTHGCNFYCNVSTLSIDSINLFNILIIYCNYVIYISASLLLLLNKIEIYSIYFKNHEFIFIHCIKPFHKAKYQINIT